MQPFDALTIRAVLQEAKPLLINRKVDKVVQLARDEILISLWSKGGTINLFMSAQSVYGRMCLVNIPSGGEPAATGSKAPAVQKDSERGMAERYQSKYGAGAPPNFCLVLRKHLTGATLIGVEQLPGERVIDFVFSCTNEVGATSLKVLTSEIMGRHSNLIFWQKDNAKILSASHVVTKDMSRQREVLPNLLYERPPTQDRPSIFSISESEFKTKVNELIELVANQKPAHSENQASEAAEGGATSERVRLRTPGVEDESAGDEIIGNEATDSEMSEGGGARVATAGGERQPGVIATTNDTERAAEESTAGEIDAVRDKPGPVTLEHWMISTFTGVGKHLSEEIVTATGLDSMLANSYKILNLDSLLWGRISYLQSPSRYRPYMRKDLSRYTVLGWYPNCDDESVFQKFPTVNDMVEHYFRSLEAREQFVQLREKIKVEILSEVQRLETRKQIAEQHLSAEGEIERLKKFGDLILTSLNSIAPGQTDLTVGDWAPDNGGEVTIKLNPNLSCVQNAQSYYRQYAKLRSRQGAAQGTVDEVTRRLTFLAKLRTSCEEALDIFELRRIKENFSGRRRQEKPRPRHAGTATADQSKRPKAKTKMISLTSSDGWTIYVGRNRMENDQLINKVANSYDVWLHVLGQGGAHVLIRVPSNKQEPPKTTIQEAAEIAARFSKAAAGSKVRVIYTQCRYVKRADPNKPGLVRYENEKTIEIDTARPMPNLMKKLFS